MDNWVVGIDLGATKIALGLIDPQDRIIAYRRLPTHAADGPSAAVECIGRSMIELEQELPAGQHIAAVGVCSPGPLDHRRGVILDPPNLSGWRQVPFRQMLADHLHMPVSLEHDAKAAALGEFYYGAGRGEQSMVYIVVGTGVGAAFIIDGQLYRGMHNLAGEVGGMTIDRDGEEYRSGVRGCVQSYICGPDLARHYQRRREQAKPQPPSGPDQPVTGELVAQLAGQGDEPALQVITQAGEALGVAVASLAMILDIELYVIGGSVAKSGDLLLEPARRAVPLYAFHSIASQVRIVTAGLGDDGPILGCGWLARRALAGKG
ncbi:MAG: ROK family protein [Chloroflexota bacterium]